MTSQTHVTEIAVRLVPADQRERWDAFLDGCVNDTIYQRELFLQSHGSRAQEVWRLMFEVGGRTVAALAGGLVAGDTGPELRAPFSASFGGISHLPALTVAEGIEIVRALEAFARGRGVRRVTIQQPPVIYARPPTELIEFALTHGGYTLVGHELTYYLPSLEAASDVVFRNVQKGSRAGLQLRPCDPDTTWTFLRDRKEAKGHAFGIIREALLGMAAGQPDWVHCQGAFLNDDLVAASIVYDVNARVALGLHWAHDESRQDLRPTDFLLHGVVESAFARGRSYFDLGTVTLGGEPVRGVAQFKEKFRPSSLLRRRFSKSLD